VVSRQPECAIERLTVSAYTVPTETPESDGFLRVGPLCEARSLPLSAHTAPSLHAHLCCALPSACHVEFFFDHAQALEAVGLRE